MKKPERLGIVLLFIGSFWAVIIYWIVVASMPYNPLSVPTIITLNLQTICPQGWGFFTRNPREAHTYFYRIENEKLVQQRYHNSKAKHLFGVQRTARLQALELATLAGLVKEEKWIACKNGIKNLSNLEEIPSISIENTFGHPKLCGDLIIEQKEPVPWAWNTQTSADEVPSKIVKIKAICSP